MLHHTDFKLHPQVIQIGYYWGEDGHAEVYLLEGERPVLIDTGTISTPKTYLVPALDTAGYRLSDIRMILNTHGHYDHVSGNQAVVDASGAKVWLPDADADIAQNFEIQFERYFSHRDVLADRPDRYAEAFKEIKQHTALTPIDEYLRDGQQIDLGRGIQLDVVAAPGHSPGSVVFYWERAGIVFTGDSVVGAGSRPGGLPWIFFPGLYKRSLRRLLALDIGTICLGHHYFSLTQTRTSVKYGEDIQKFLIESEQVLDILHSCIWDTAQDSDENNVAEVIRQALPKIQKYFPVTVDSQSGLPMRLGATGTLQAIWQELLKNNGKQIEV
jgi:glyoxylase-like metal-dependent hydrolase (beta-lactamase superfamily II)